MNRCEDFPCCGHEAGDCDGSLYGSDESIKGRARQHAGCDHEAGHCEVAEWEAEQKDECTCESWTGRSCVCHINTTRSYDVPVEQVETSTGQVTGCYGL